MWNLSPLQVAAIEELVPNHQVRVLGNPVTGSLADMEISGAGGQSVTLRLLDLQGRSLHEQRIKQAGSLERVRVPMSNSQVLLLVNVSTTAQQQQVKLIKPR